MRWFAYTTHGATNAPNSEKTCARPLTHRLPITFSWRWIQAILGSRCLWLFIATGVIFVGRKRRCTPIRFVCRSIFKSNSFPSNALQSENVSFVCNKLMTKNWMENCHFECHHSHSKFTWRLHTSHAHHSLAVNDDIVRFKCLHTSRNE